MPTAGEQRGKAAVGEPREYVATGDTVVALGHYTATTPLAASTSISRWSSA